MIFSSRDSAEDRHHSEDRDAGKDHQSFVGIVRPPLRLLWDCFPALGSLFHLFLVLDFALLDPAAWLRGGRVFCAVFTCADKVRRAKHRPLDVRLVRGLFFRFYLEGVLQPRSTFAPPAGFLKPQARWREFNPFRELRLVTRTRSCSIPPI